MKKQFCLPVLIATVLSGCAGYPESDLERVSADNKEEHRRNAEEFASWAAQRNIAALMEQMAAVTVELNGRAALEDYLKQTVVPFFRDYRRMDWGANYHAVADEQGNTGVQYYEFIETTGGASQPFVITFFPEGSGLKVTSIIVGECYPGYHSACP